MTEDLIYGYLLGTTGTMIGIYFNHRLSISSKQQENEKFKLALKPLFSSCVQAFIDYVSIRRFNSGALTADWNNIFWQKNQITLAQHDPLDTARFATLVNSYACETDHSDVDFLILDLQKLYRELSELK